MFRPPNSDKRDWGFSVMNMPGNNDDWSACPSGTFDRVRDQLPAESRQRSMKPFVTGASLVAVAAAVLFGFSLLGGNGEDPAFCPPEGSMLCGEVISLLPDYIAKRTDAETTKEITEHLSYCVTCQDKYKELTGHLPSQTAAHESHQRSPLAVLFFQHYASR